jgi:tetratricopeptide (TPR) repeat protein
VIIVRMFGIRTVVVLLASFGVVSPGAAQSNRWTGPKCDLKPGHYLVNSGQLYLKSAAETRFEDQKQKDLRDANRVLIQSVTTGSQDRNPAAWYFLGRYYLMTDDAAGADSAFAHAERLKPECKEDITFWRRTLWVPILNAGVAAWQANNLDSAMSAFRRANALNQSEPQGFKYLASLMFNAGQQDSAIHYFRRTADIAATNPEFAQDRKDALFNMARIQHSMQRWPDAEATYREYLTLYPNDAEVLASLGSVQLQRGQRDSALTIYKRIIARGDSVGSIPLFRAGVEIYQSAPPEPDTAAAANTCRTEARASRLPAARVRARCDSVTSAMVREHAALARGTYQLAAQAFETGLKLNPYYRDGLFNLVNTYLTLNDSTAMLASAQRLVSVDPLNRMSLRLLAFSHQRLGRVDSTLHYLRIADSLLVADVTVSEFDPDDQGSSLKGLVTNMRSTANAPFKLIFEFLDARGQVVATQSVDIPAIQPQESHPFETKALGAGILAWRYRKE